MNIRKIDDFHWKIPKSGDMNVPAKVIASEKLLKEIKQDKTLNQIRNVATLPGIYKNAICLPDGHQGYGFPIGGVAALDYEEGGISPGGVGYDINCLAGDSQIVTEFGTCIEISEFEKFFEKVKNGNTLQKEGLIKLQTLSDQGFEGKDALMFMSREAQIYEITTEAGLKLKATADHPFLTSSGMVELGELEEGDEVAVSFFEGVEHEEKEDSSTLLSEGDFSESVARELKKRDLLPLKESSTEARLLAKLIGYSIGDGTVYFSNEKGYINFYGEEEDLEFIMSDLSRLGFSTSIHSRERDHQIDDQYGSKQFSALHHELHCSSKSLARVFSKLGVPVGSNTTEKVRVPPWIMNGSKVVRRLFLAGFFGAELSSPSTHTKTGFYAPILSQNKNEGFVEDGRKFMIQIMGLLEDFGINCTKISTREEHENKSGKTFRIRLLISAEEDNLLRLCRKIGFEYNEKRRQLAEIASHYILLKKRENKFREELTEKIKEYKKKGLNIGEVKDLLADKINERFIERHYYKGAGQRISLDFISFDDFLKKSKSSLEEHKTLFDQVVNVEKMGSERVYDFNVSENHNFVANGFVVSNCGVRLLRTNLDKGDVESNVKELLNTFYNNVPSGVGSKAKIKLNGSELNEVLERGVRWAVENGYGWDQDLKHLEENGRMKQADVSKVSAKAKNRGIPQLGSLGSGNHFLEIQKVDEIYDEEVAKKFGIERENQVTVMIHTGSRGFGHQVCTDYLRKIEDRYPEIVGRLPDKELMYAPAGSQLADDYFGAMCAAANYAFTNRQMIMHWVRKSFESVLDGDAHDWGMELVYGLCHNMAKVEKHKINGKTRKVYMHRKGATRAFPPSHKKVPPDYRSTGQPVLIPGTMGTSSYLLAGTKKGMKESFGSTAHGAGRTMSRRGAKSKFWGEDVKDRLEKDEDIFVKPNTMPVVAEEAPGAYKDIDEVVNVSDKVGIGNVVARMKPMGVVKG